MKLVMMTTGFLLASGVLGVMAQPEDASAELKHKEEEIEKIFHIRGDKSNDGKVGNAVQSQNGMSISNKPGEVFKEDMFTNFFLNTRVGSFLLWLAIKWHTTRFRVQWMFGKLIQKIFETLRIMKKTSDTSHPESHNGLGYAKKMESAFWKHFKDPKGRHIQKFDEEQEKARVERLKKSKATAQEGSERKADPINAPKTEVIPQNAGESTVRTQRPENLKRLT